VRFDQKDAAGNYLFYREPKIMASRHRDAYLEVMNLLFDTYSRQMEPMLASIAKALPIEQLEVISASQALEEELFLGLRQLAGIDLDRLQQFYGVLLSDRFLPLESSGLLERDGAVVRLAPKHLSISNEVFVELMR